MDKEKKITIQFHANNKLKPKQSVWNGSLTEVFPLYVMVIYDANNTQFKVDINGETILVSSDLSQLSVPELKSSLEKYKKYILKVVESEIEHLGKNFSLTGLGYRCLIYSRKVSDIVGNTVLAEVDEIIAKKGYKLTKVKDSKGSVLQILKKEKNMKVLDWLYGNGRHSFTETLSNHGFVKNEIDIEIYLIDEILKEGFLCFSA
ncbi:MAG: hypothetical protein IPJ74_09410 [Saprospiraceae bacterium]|nr:hypothetical protein [Saprospiraceae bacterium]